MPIPYSYYDDDLAIIEAEQAAQRNSLMGMGPLGPQMTMAQQRLRQNQQRASDVDLYMRHNYPALAGMARGVPTTIIGKNINAPRIKTGRGRGYPEGSYSVPEGGYSPRVIASGPQAAAVPVRQMPTAALIPQQGGWSPPMSVSEVIADQRKEGTAPEPLVITGGTPAAGGGYTYMGPAQGAKPIGVGYMPTSAGYMYSGSKEGFADELARRDDALMFGLSADELADYGLPPMDIQ